MENHHAATLNWRIERDEHAQCVLLSGELSRDTLLPLWEQRASFFSANQPFVWDLADLTRIDSAGFALLADLIHTSSQHAPTTLKNVPQDVQTLAELVGLKSWLADFL